MTGSLFLPQNARQRPNQRQATRGARTVLPHTTQLGLGMESTSCSGMMGDRPDPAPSAQEDSQDVLERLRSRDEFLVDKRSTTFQAELRVLEAIKQPRQSHARTGNAQERTLAEKPWLSLHEAERLEDAKPKYLSMSKAELAAFRPAVPLEQQREAVDEEVEEAHVMTLPRRVDVAESSTGLSRLKRTAKSRQVRHEEALRAFKDAVIGISEDLEAKVIERGRGLREALEQADTDVAQFERDFSRDDVLRAEDYAFVAASRTTLEALCKARKQAILDFDARMQAVEAERSALVGAELRALVDRLVAVSYRLRGEVERLVEKEAHEVNMVLISNLSTKDDLVARMLRRHVKVHFRTQATWADAEQRWRKLRHERALVEWTEELASETFTDPPERNAVIAALQGDQQAEHDEQRLDLLADLERLVPKVHLPRTQQEQDELEDKDGDNEEEQQRQQQQDEEAPVVLSDLTPERVEAIRVDLAKLDTAATQRCASARTQLAAQQEAMRLEMDKAREALRAELHSYAALASEGDIFTHGDLGHGSLHRVRIGAAVADAELEDFFRRAGALKPELEAVVSGFGRADLIHNSNVHALQERVQLLVEAAEVAGALEREGKSAALAALQHTLEALRTAKKADLAPLVPVLHRQARALRDASDRLGHAVVGEADRALELLEVVQPSLAKGKVADDGEPAERVGKSDEDGHDGNDNEEDGEDDDEDEEEDRAQAAELAYKEKPLDLTKLRKAQTRLGILAHASALPEALREELALSLATLEKQVRINGVIDGVVAQHCEDTIVARGRQAQALWESFVEHLELQRLRLEHNGAKLCAFVASLAVLVRDAAETRDATDLRFERALDQLAGSFEDDDDAREAAFADASDKLRHAPDSEALGELFRQALEILGEVDAGYRDYHKEAILLSKQHPRQADEDGAAQRDRIAECVGLVQQTPQVSQTQAEEVQQVQDTVVAVSEAQHGDEGGGAGEEGGHEEGVGEAAKEPVEGTVEGEGVDGEDGVAAEPSESTCVEAEEVEEDGEKVVVALPQTQAEEEPVADIKVLTIREFAFAERESCRDIAFGLLNPPLDEDDDEDEEDVNDDESDEDGVAEEAVEETKEGGNDAVASEPREGDPAAVAVEGSPEEGAEKGSAADGEAQDEEEQEQEEGDAEAALPEWATVAVDAALVEALVSRLRSAVLASSCGALSERGAEMALLSSERCDEYTAELEDRLRLHWPRKGRTDVKFQQPRKGELLQHKQRHNRHVRAVVLRSKAQQETFVDQLAQTKAGLRRFRQYMNGLALHFEAQSNVAALHGVLKRGKTAVVEFQEQMTEHKEDLMPLVRRSNDLLDMNAGFLGTCTCFAEGGDYNEAEVELEREALQSVEEDVLRGVNERAEEMRVVFAQVRAARLDLAARLQQRFEACLEAVSVREGLGRKYGAPRRVAQEKLRSQVALSDAAERYVDGALAQLEALCESSAPCSKAPRLAVDVKRCVDTLCKCIWRRAKYLGFLADPANAPRVDDACDLGDEASPPSASAGADGQGPGTAEAAKEREGQSQGQGQGEGQRLVPGVRGPTEDEVTVAMGTDADVNATFRVVVEEADGACQTATLELYEREGMLGELQESGKRLAPDGPLLPESLAGFLAEFRGKAGAYEEKAARRLREQAAALQELLLRAPAVVLRHLCAQAAARAGASKSAAEDAFAGFHAQSEAAKAGHLDLLRPQLGDPNNVEELAVLCRSEAARAAQASRRIAATYAGLARELGSHAEAFVGSLQHTFATLARIMDACLVASDFKALPGDDLVASKRMGLRKLRNARRKHEDPEASAPLSTGRKVPKKLCPGLDVSRVRRVLVVAARPLEGNEGKGVEGDDEEEESKGKGKEDKEGEKDKDKDKEGEEAAEITTMAMKTADVETLSTPQHRCAVAARQSAFDDFAEWFEENSRAAEAHFRGLLEDEASWTENWERSLTQLRNLN